VFQTFILKALDALNGSKTYLGALGLFGLAAYDVIVTHDYTGAILAGAQALGLFGIRHAISKSSGVDVAGLLSQVSAFLDQLAKVPDGPPAPPAATK
jgi:hypothetical protein